MSSIYQRNGVWYIQYLTNGQLTQKSLKTKDPRMAKQLQKQLDAQYTLGTLNLVKGKVPLKMAFNKLLEIKRPTLRPSSFKRYQGITANLMSFLSGISREYANDLTDTDVARYITTRREEKASDKTIHEELVILKSAVKMLIEYGHLASSPVKRWPTVKQTAKKPDTIGGYTPEEICNILGYFAQSPNLDYYLGLLYTGCRRSELWSISKADINFATNTIRISSIKTGTNPGNQFRYLEIHPVLLPILHRRTQGKNNDDAVFPIQGKGLWLLRALRKACRVLGIQYRRLHGLRHAFISTLLNSGVPLRAVMAMAGHADFQTTLRYSHISQNEMRGKICQLNYEIPIHQVRDGTAPDTPIPVPLPAFGTEYGNVTLLEGPRKLLDQHTCEKGTGSADKKKTTRKTVICVRRHKGRKPE